MMASRLLPFLAAVVANSAGSECPATVAGSSPAWAATRWTMRATLRSLRASGWTRPYRLSARKSAPDAMPEASSQASSARTAHTASQMALRNAFLGSPAPPGPPSTAGREERAPRASA